MGCICCPLGNFISSLLYAVERISTCAACAALVACMLLTIVVSCVFGVALGYHFCVVEHNAEAMDKATIGDLSAGGEELDRRRSGGGVAPPRRELPTRGHTIPNPASYLLEDSKAAGDRDRRRSVRANATSEGRAIDQRKAKDERLKYERRGTDERRVVERGVMERGAVERGVVERGVVERGVVERGMVQSVPMGRYLERYKRHSPAINSSWPLFANVSRLL